MVRATSRLLALVTAIARYRSAAHDNRSEYESAACIQATRRDRPTQSPPHLRIVVALYPLIERSSAAGDQESTGERPKRSCADSRPHNRRDA